ncbi:MAG: hypothetical protein ABJF11_19455 [Reichenbachiella sp.]|uniref:hypothetical protein n=1 Tax=Reichenbachiella sp. TaxID=2184521 RepID=UPI003264C73F
MKGKILIGLVVQIFFVWSCSEDNESQTSVITGAGNEISMDGIWESECLDFTDFRLREDFDFDGDNLVITIDRSSAETCDQIDDTEKVTITFRVVGTIEVQLDGATVLANKISGTQKSDGDGSSSEFKQSFYIDESDDTLILYHGVFEDDGGMVSSDGYPLELHPFAISKR